MLYLLFLHISTKLPHINAEIALRKILTANNVTEQRDLGTLAYQMKCKWGRPGEERGTETEGRAVTTVYM
jgi:hypothetical protein